MWILFCSMLWEPIVVSLCVCVWFWSPTVHWSSKGTKGFQRVGEGLPPRDSTNYMYICFQINNSLCGVKHIWSHVCTMYVIMYKYSIAQIKALMTNKYGSSFLYLLVFIFLNWPWEENLSSYLVLKVNTSFYNETKWFCFSLRHVFFRSWEQCALSSNCC